MSKALGAKLELISAPKAVLLGFLVTVALGFEAVLPNLADLVIHAVHEALDALHGRGLANIENEVRDHDALARLKLSCECLDVLGRVDHVVSFLGNCVEPECSQNQRSW
jgi:hypothetical protein